MQINRKKVLQYFHNLGIDILFLQETHFPKTYRPTFLHARYPTFYLASADKTKGVAIIFSRNCNFSPVSSFPDPRGRFLLVNIEGVLYYFIAYYAPNQNQFQFFQSMFTTLNPLLEGVQIFGGDSNVAFDQSLDKKRPPVKQHLAPSKQSICITRLLASQGLVDIWSETNPTRKDYTHFSNPHLSFARIDHIFVSTAHVPMATKAFIRDSTWSDHSGIFLHLLGRGGHTREFRWKLNGLSSVILAS